MKFLNNIKRLFIVVLFFQFSGCIKDFPETNTLALLLLNSNATANTQTFSPDDLSGLLLWLKADALALNDGDPVSSWTDSSGNGFNAEQAVAASQPVYKKGILSSKPWVQFDGVDDTLATANTDLGTFSIFVVVQATGASHTLPYMHGISNGIGTYMNLHCCSTINVGRAGVISSKSLTPLWALDSTYRILSHVFDGTHAGNNLYSNGTLLALTDGSIADPGIIPQNYPFQVGNWSGFSYYVNGSIPELIVYSRSLSDAERTQVEQYLNAKYSVY